MVSDYIVKIVVKNHDTAVDVISKELSHTSLRYSIDDIDGTDVYLVVTVDGDNEDNMTEYVEQELSLTKLKWNIEDVFDSLDDELFGPVTPFVNEDGGL